MTLQNFTLGTFAQQGVTAGSFESIASFTLGSAGSISFTSIPQTYKHLQVRTFMRGTFAAATDTLGSQINNDSGANYVFHRLYGDGSSAVSQAFTGQSYAFMGDMPANTATSGVYAASVIDYLDYTDTNKFKTIRNITGRDVNGSGYIWFISNLWRSTSAITRLDFWGANANLAAGTTIALYGIKAA